MLVSRLLLVVLPLLVDGIDDDDDDDGIDDGIEEILGLA